MGKRRRLTPLSTLKQIQPESPGYPLNCVAGRGLPKATAQVHGHLGAEMPVQRPARKRPLRLISQPNLLPLVYQRQCESPRQNKTFYQLKDGANRWNRGGLFFLRSQLTACQHVDSFFNSSLSVLRFLVGRGVEMLKRHLQLSMLQ